MAASLDFTPKTSLTEKIVMAPYHILIVMIRYVNSEILVVLTKSEQFGPRSAHIRPTISHVTVKLLA